MAYAALRFDATDEAGNILTNVMVEIRRESGGLQQAYQDRAGTVSLGSTFLVPDGKVFCHLPGNAYRVTLRKGGYERVLRFVAVGRGAEADLQFARPKGEYDPEAIYETSDYVRSGSSLFASLVDENEGNAPQTSPPGDTEFWMYLGPFVPGEQGVGDKFDAVIFAQGKPRPGELLLRQVFSATPITFPAGLTGSAASSEVAADDDAEFILAKNGTAFGTVTFEAASQIGLIVAPGAVTFDSFDILTITAPDPRDATLADISITLTGNR
ncbi:hypothetical protein EMQ25_05755 [Arsenicitalea aurantiaca]|uniref:Uncharacterized protein n=1 Tax=Arsenicitalea aurantiaca TaxID=1783274 RepID=A0A433XF18_9HYPH|nr:hypothetical protein [Arsenicitalea aurantiaca]RUT32650.1 hypothetical protein EMQ25_05755 [Arsenicitalea aurantiaca]